MRLTLDIKPIKHIARTKAELVWKMGMTGYFSSSTYGCSHYISDHDCMCVFTCQKFRPMFIQHKDDHNNTTSKKIREGYWEGYVYRIPKAFLDAAGLKVVQNNRTFKLERRKK
jgi:hypothetical protein